MSAWVDAIASGLSRVRELRRDREAEAHLGARVRAVKAFQQARFERDYADLLTSPRYGEAARFFLDQLYGPADFALRDAEFERVVPLMARVLSDDVMRTIADLIDLHALTEGLDQQMGLALRAAELDERSYRAAWRQVGLRSARDRQLTLLLSAGRALERHTRNKLLTGTLRLMRAPAQAAGYGRLQSFLEAGMDAFAGMGGAREFLQVIEDNERRTIDDLFTSEP